MRDNICTISYVSKDEAAQLTSDSEHNHIWHPGIYVIIDNSRCILETIEEATVLIEALQAAQKTLAHDL